MGACLRPSTQTMTLEATVLTTAACYFTAAGGTETVPTPNSTDDITLSVKQVTVTLMDILGTTGEIHSTLSECRK